MLLQNTPRATAQEQGGPSAAAAKWKVIQQNLKLNVQDLKRDFKSVVQQAVAQHAADSRGSKPYSRMTMTSKDEAVIVPEEGRERADEGV